MNCTDAGAECLRNRQARVHRPRVSRLETLTQRLAKLEESTNKEATYFPTRHHAASSTSSSPSVNRANITEVFNDKQKRYRAYDLHDTAPLQPPLSKHRKSQTVAQQNVHQTHSPSSTHRACEAREYIEHELKCNPSLSKDRRTALESARKFVSRLSNPTLNFEETAAIHDMDVQENLEPPTLTPELLFMMLPGPDKRTNSQGAINWPDHISNKVLEQMGLAIIEGTECEQVLQYYRINVWVKAMGFISNVSPLLTSEPLGDHFRSLKKRYEVAAVEILNQIPMAAEPSLLLLQSILSAARLMRYLGNMTRSWMLISQASMMIVSLNYHNITDPSPRNEIEENIHDCVYTCYYFDKTLSLLLLRPPSLPDLKVKPTLLIHLDPDLPTSAMMKGIIEYSEVTSDLLKVLLDTKRTIGDTEKANILSDLVARAHIIHSDLQIFRHRQKEQHPELWRQILREWSSMDFNYYSVLTTIIRARSSVLKSHLVCENCLYTAREALTTLRVLQEAFSSHTNSIDSYPRFLTWTMLLFPLAPFFVLFCNVIATSNERDFSMIKNITDNLRQFAEANASIGKLYKLFSKFLDICAPLVKGNPKPSRSEQPAVALSDANTVGNTEGQVESYTNILGRAADADQDLVSLGGTDSTGGGPTAPPSVEGWDDNLVWDLFNNQPSLGWADSELWNVMSQFDS